MPTDRKEKDTEDALPNEAWGHIFSFVDNSSLFRTNQVSTFFYAHSKKALFSRKGMAALRSQKEWLQNAIEAKSKKINQEILLNHLKNPILTAGERAKALHLLAEKQGIALQVDKATVKLLKKNKDNLSLTLNFNIKKNIQKTIKEMLTFLCTEDQAYFLTKKDKPVIDEEVLQTFTKILSISAFQTHPHAEKFKASLLKPFQSWNRGKRAIASLTRKLIVEEFFTPQDISDFIAYLPDGLKCSKSSCEIMLDFLKLMAPKLTITDVPLVLSSLYPLLNSGHIQVLKNTISILGSLKPLLNINQFTTIFPKVLTLLQDKDYSVHLQACETLCQLLKETTEIERAFFLKHFPLDVSCTWLVRQAMLGILTQISGDLAKTEVESIYPATLAEFNKDENTSFEALKSLIPKLDDKDIISLLDQLSLARENKLTANQSYLMAALIPRLDSVQVSSLLNKLATWSYEENIEVLYHALLPRLTETYIKDFVDQYASMIKNVTKENARIFFINAIASLLTEQQLLTILFATFKIDREQFANPYVSNILKAIAPFLKKETLTSLIALYSDNEEEKITRDAFRAILSALNPEQASIVFNNLKLKFANVNSNADLLFLDHLHVIADKLDTEAISDVLKLMPAYLGHAEPLINGQAEKILGVIVNKFENVHVAIFLEQFPNYFQHDVTQWIALHTLNGLPLKIPAEQLSLITKEILAYMKEQHSDINEIEQFLITHADNFSCQDINRFFQEIKNHPSYPHISIYEIHVFLDAIKTFFPHFEQAHYDIIVNLANHVFKVIDNSMYIHIFEKALNVLTLIAPHLAPAQCSVVIESLQSKSFHKYGQVSESLQDFIAYLLVLGKMPIDQQQKFPLKDYPQLVLPLTIASWQEQMKNALSLAPDTAKLSLRMK